nr:helix-turn-helix domain-containing protein [Bacteroides clarus]
MNVSPRTLQTLRDNGKLPYSQIQHKIFYKLEDVEALLTFVGLQRKEKILKSKNINQ